MFGVSGPSAQPRVEKVLSIEAGRVPTKISNAWVLAKGHQLIPSLAL